MSNDEEVERPGALYTRTVGDGYQITVYAMLFGNGRICYGPREAAWIDDAWCYPSVAAALEAARAWDGEGDPPDGWHRHPNSGRRREGGDPAKESVRW